MSGLKHIPDYPPPRYEDVVHQSNIIQNSIYVRVNNLDGYTLLFPFELSNLDYIRRILEFLRDGLFRFVDIAIKHNTVMRNEYEKIKREGKDIDDIYYILRCLKDSHESWARDIGYSPQDIFPSLNFLFNLRNSFAHQNKEVNHIQKGKVKNIW